MESRRNVVSVRYENRKTGGYSENAYSYYSEVPDLKAGDMVKVPTRYGTSRAIVHEVGLSDAAMPAALRQHLKTITAECLIADDGEHQEQMDLSNPVDDFFKE